MRTTLLAACVLLLAACTSNRNAGRRADTAPAAPPPRAFAIDYVASPQAHFDAVAEHNRAQEAAAKGNAKTPATGFPAPSSPR
jgi:hypothetical protein